jgi:hypothetical protein
MTLKIRLNSLDLKCKHDDDQIPFTDISYFYGEMGAGKTSIAKLIDYCLGGDIKLSAALQAEFNSAILHLSINGNPLSLERVRNSEQIVASWTKNEEQLEVVVSAKKATQEIIPGSGLENLSDLIFYLADITPPKVRRSKKQDDSQLQRLSIRNLLWYCYLDQDTMDSSFYNLDPEANPFKTNASKDVLRYVIGFHQEQVAELEAELQSVREERLALQTGAESLRTVLEGEGIGEKKNIEAHIIELQQELTRVQDIISASRKERQLIIPHPVDVLRQKARELAYELNSVDDAIASIESSIGGNKRHLNELTMLKVKYKRISSAKNILIGVEFTHCPRCSQLLQPHIAGECPVCGQLEPEDPQFEIKEEVIDSDTNGRIAELSEIIERNTGQLKTLKARQQELILDKQKTDQLINEGLKQYDSSYLSSTLDYERQKAEISQTILKLNDYIRLTTKVEELYKKAEALEAEEAGLRRRLKEARAEAEGDVTNLRQLEGLFLDCLLRSKLSGFTPNDHVAIEPPHFLPQVISPDVGEMSITSFENLSSGGKKSIFKACFAIALHRLAVRINAVLPTFMIIDSPMKNISERINREQFEGFHHLLYELAETELLGTQLIVIDKEYFPPEYDLSINFSVRHMTTGDPEHPPLIKHYRGH